MASITGSDLEAASAAVQRLEYRHAEDTFSWVDDYSSWAKAEQDTRNNLFSSCGSVPGVTFTMRKSSRLSMF